MCLWAGSKGLWPFPSTTLSSEMGSRCESLSSWWEGEEGWLEHVGVREEGTGAQGDIEAHGLCLWKASGSRAAGDALGADVSREAAAHGCQETHNEGAGGAEGEGTADIEVGGIQRDQHTDEVETLCLGEIANSG